MAEINKIKVGDSTYDIVPRLGTGLYCDEGAVAINLGSGFSISNEKKLTINFGTSFYYNSTSGKIEINLGTAVVEEQTDTDCGISINEKGFIIKLDIFKAFLRSLGVQFAPL